jgi:hypothetical protein
MAQSLFLLVIYFLGLTGIAVVHDVNFSWSIFLLRVLGYQTGI